MTYRNLDRLSGTNDFDTAGQAFRSTHGYRADHTVTQLLLDFESQVAIFNTKRVINFGQLILRELHVHHSTDNLNNISGTHFLVLCDRFAVVFFSGKAPNKIKLFT
jgi:hypothetical protein